MTIKKGHEIPTIDVALVTIKKAGSTEELALDTASKIAVEVSSETQEAVKLIIKGKLRAQKKAVSTVTGNTITLTDNVFIPELVKVLQGGTIKYKTIYTLNTVQASGNYSFTIGSNQYVNYTLDVSTALAEGDTLVFDDYSNKLIKNGTTEIVCTIETTSEGTLVEPTKLVTDIITGYTPPVAGSDEKGEAFELTAYSPQYDGAGGIVQYEKIAYPNCTGNPISISSEDGAFRVPEYTIDSAPQVGQAPYTISYVPTLPTVTV